jgi:hypothetical protein
VLVLADRQDAEGDSGKLSPVSTRCTPGMSLGASGVDADDPRVRDGGAQQLAVQHARQLHIVGEAGLAGGLGATIDPPPRPADDARAAHRAAFITASTICR